MHWLFFALFSTIFVLALIGDAVALVMASFKKRVSLVPFIGGVSGAIAILIAPVPEWRSWWQGDCAILGNLQ
jgi:hypothetical protein